MRLAALFCFLILASPTLASEATISLPSEIQNDQVIGLSSAPNGAAVFYLLDDQTVGILIGQINSANQATLRTLTFEGYKGFAVSDPTGQMWRVGIMRHFGYDIVLDYYFLNDMGNIVWSVKDRPPGANVRFNHTGALVWEKVLDHPDITHRVFDSATGELITTWNLYSGPHSDRVQFLEDGLTALRMRKDLVELIRKEHPESPDHQMVWQRIFPGWRTEGVHIVGRWVFLDLSQPGPEGGGETVLFDLENKNLHSLPKPHNCFPIAGTDYIGITRGATWSPIKVYDPVERVIIKELKLDPNLHPRFFDYSHGTFTTLQDGKITIRRLVD